MSWFGYCIGLVGPMMQCGGDLPDGVCRQGPPSSASAPDSGGASLQHPAAQLQQHSGWLHFVVPFLAFLMLFRICDDFGYFACNFLVLSVTLWTHFCSFCMLATQQCLFSLVSVWLVHWCSLLPTVARNIPLAGQKCSHTLD